MMTTKIEKALSLGKLSGAKALLNEYYLAEDKAQWLETKQAEYDILYPLFQYAEAYELNVIDEYGTLEDDWVVYDSTIDEHGVSLYCLQKKIDYSEDENYVTFNDWLNETRVVSEAVEATYDEEGIELTPYQPQVTELVRPYVANDVTPLVDAYIGSKYAELRASAYPPMADYLDAVVKNDTIAIQKYIDACLAVKAKYPKE